MSVLAVGGPRNGEVIESASPVVWGSKRPSYFRQVIKNGSKSAFMYLHKSVLRRLPNPEVEIRKFVIPVDCGVSRDWDLEVIAYNWWLFGDLPRHHYSLFLIG